MTRLLLHQKTADQIQSFLQKPSHGLLIKGAAGSGKQTVARFMAAQLVGVDETALDQYPYFSLVAKPPDKQEISIGSVRQLIKELRLKPVIARGGKAQKVVLIAGADLLSEEGQNAILKLLEEPPPSTVIILTVSADKPLRPTISSRVQKITIAPINLAAAKKFFDNYSPQAVEAAWSLSQGAVGLLAAILQGETNHPLKQAVDNAKKLLTMGRYERVIFLDSLSADKVELLNFLDGLNQVLAALHHSAINSHKISLANKLAKSRQLVNAALVALSNNTSPRLIGLHLALNLLQ